jgi:hypothetical protein
MGARICISLEEHVKSTSAAVQLLWLLVADVLEICYGHKVLADESTPRQFVEHI